MALRDRWMKVPRGVAQAAAGMMAVGTACGGELALGPQGGLRAGAPASRAAMAAAGQASDSPLQASDSSPQASDRPLQTPAALAALAHMTLEDVPEHADSDVSSETLDLTAPRALLAHVDEAPLPDEVLDHSSLDDLLLVLNSQAEHLRMSGEVVLCRAEDAHLAAATETEEMPPILVELALSAQEAADALTAAVSEVAEGEDLFIPASAVSANHTVVEKLSRTEGKRFSDTYIHEQIGTLQRAKKTLKQAFQLSPRYTENLDRAARRLNKAFLLFDFVKEKAVAAVDNPVEAIRFGSGFVEQAADLLHSDSDSDSEADAASKHKAKAHAAADAAGSQADEGGIAEVPPPARDPAKQARRVRFSLDTDAPAEATPTGTGRVAGAGAQSI